MGTSSQTGAKMQSLLSEPFFQDIMNDLEMPPNEDTLIQKERQYRAMKNDLYVYYHEGKQLLFKQITEMTRLLSDRRKFRQTVVDAARKDPKQVHLERVLLSQVLGQIDDIKQEIELEREKQATLDDMMEEKKRRIWECEKVLPGYEEYELILQSEAKTLEKRLHTIQTQYNEKLGRIKEHKVRILNLESEHKGYVDKARALEFELQVVRNMIVETLKSAKPILKKQAEFMNNTISAKNRADKQKAIDQRDLENQRTKMDDDTAANKHILEKNNPRGGPLKHKGAGHPGRPQGQGRGNDAPWSPIMHVGDASANT